MKLTLILLFIFYPGYGGALGGKFCRGSGGYSGKCTSRVDCKGSSFSFSTTCGFGHVCCKTRGDVVTSEVEFPPSCGKSTLHLPHRGAGSSHRRHGTNLAQPGQLPWMVSFVYQRSGENFCGGVLISSKHVLTAGHCFAGVDPDQLPGLVGVRVGLADLSQPPGDQPRIHWVQIHQQFQNTSGILAQPAHDIALVTLDREVQTSHTISQICLPDLSRRKEKIVRSVIAGWGATSSDQLQSVEQLRFGQVDLVHRERCQSMYDNWGASKVVIDKGMICAGGEEVDACAGDSGAPLMVQQSDDVWVVAGLVSFGPARCGSLVPGVYVKVRQYLPWIYSTMGRTK